MNHHEILGVGPGASDTEIQRAYRKAAKEVHPDLSDSPEAAEAFQRIKRARDELLKQAETPRDTDSIRRSTAQAVKATAQSAFQTPSTVPPLTPEEIADIQELDRLAAEKPRFSFFRRNKESAEVKRHRHRIKTNNRRLDGKY